MDDPRSTAVRHPGRLKVLGSAVFGALLVAGLAACNAGGGGSSGNASSSGPITICEIAATSGPFSQLGTNDMLGATAWADSVNKHGGILGHKVKLIPENNASDPATAASLVHKCVTEEHADFIFGPENTATVAAAIPIANQLQTVLFSWASGWNGQSVKDSDLHSYAFPGIGNVYFADDQAMISQIIVPRHYKRVAVIDENTPGGLSNAPFMQSQASKYGYQVVATQIINPGSTNDTPQVLNLLKAHPDVIVLGLTPGPDTITFLKAMRAQNPTIPIGECSGCATTQFVNAVGGPQAMKNIYLIGTPENVLEAFPPSPATAAGIADTKAYIAAMKGAGKGSATEIDEGSEGWATGRELADAIEKAKSIEPNAVKNALQHQKLTTGGIILYSWNRTPDDYSAMKDNGDSAMVTVGADGSFNVLPHVEG